MSRVCNESIERKISVLRVETRKSRRRERNKRFIKFAFLGVLMVVGLFIVNINLSDGLNGIVTWFNTEHDYEQSAQMVASFIQSEYDRQMNDNGEVDMDSIIKYAKKIDRNLTISYNDVQSKVAILLDADSKVVTLQSFKLE